MPEQSKNQPTPEESEKLAEEGLSTAEQMALLLFTIGIIEAAQSDGGGGITDMDIARLHRIVLLLIRMTGSQLAVEFTAVEIQSMADKIVPDLSAFTVEIRQAQSKQPKRDPGELTLQREAARALAARAYAMTLSEILGLVAETAFGTTLKKVWITRGDHRVRPLHRKLHGRVKRWDEDFWRWPATGQALRWPGDPFAPLDATINCRCFCFLSWASTPNIRAAHVPFTVPD